MYMFFAAAGVALISGIVSLFGLAKKLPVSDYEHAGLKELVSSGVQAMRDPYVVLAYLSSFAARGDSSVVTVFLAVWIQEYGKAHTTHTPAELLYHAGMITGVIQAVALISAPFIGIIADRVSHALLTLVVAAIGLMGYLLLGLLTDPYSWGPQLGFAMLGLGIGEMGLLIMSQSILGLHAPIATRGSVSGFWALCGSLGIMFGSGVGGLLYPLNPGAPFFIFAGFNLIVCVFALILYVRERLKLQKKVDLSLSSPEEKNPLIVQ
jgi:MFS family permease